MSITWIGSPNHYAGRRRYRVTRITLHIMAGWLAGTDNIFQRASYQASSTYGIGGNGETHQYVAETDVPHGRTAATQATARPVSIQHQGGLDFIQCTRACLTPAPAYARTSPAGTGSASWNAAGTYSCTGTCLPTRTRPARTCARTGSTRRYIINKANQINGYGSIDMATSSRNRGIQLQQGARWAATCTTPSTTNCPAVSAT